MRRCSRPHLIGIGATAGIVFVAAVAIVTGRDAAARDGLRRFLLALLVVFVALELRFVHSACSWIARQRGFSVGNLLDQLFRRKIFNYFLRPHTKGAERCELSFEQCVINFFGMKLEFDPLVNPDLLDALHVSGTGTEREAVEGVDGAFLLVH